MRGLLVLGAALMAVSAVMMTFAGDHRAGGPARDDFLARVDTALQKRDAASILQLADLKTWRDRFSSDPAPAAIVLPSAPITRERDLSTTEVLYLDGGGREWRLRFEERNDGYRILLFDAPCPRGRGMARAPAFERPPASRADAPQVWTPLECWPLPRY